MRFIFLINIILTLTATIKAGFINGLILDDNGKPESKVQVCIYNSDYDCTVDDSCHFPCGALSTESSSKSGKYQFKNIPSGDLIIIGKKDDKWFCRKILLNENTPELTVIDTLQNPGSLLFRVNLVNSVKHNSVTVNLPGTPFFTKATDNGVIEIKEVPKGAYQSLIRSDIRGYDAVQCSLRIRSGVQDTFPEPLNLIYTQPLPIKHFNYHMDSPAKIFLSWEYNGSGKTKFVIFKSINGKQFTRLAETFNNSFTDSVFDVVKKPFQIHYYLECNNMCYPSDTIVISINPPEKIKSAENLPVNKQKKLQTRAFKIHLSCGSTVVNPLQEVHLRGSVEPAGIAVKKWQWLINGSQLIETFIPDTILTMPVKAGSLICVLKATDNSGISSCDTVVIQIETSKLNVLAQIDSTKGLFEKITLSAQASGNNPIASLSWDIGNTGNFVATPNGRIRIGPLRSPVKNFICIARAIDQTGETAFDTVIIDLDYTWEECCSIPEFSEGKSNSLIAFKDTVWLIGGSNNIYYSKDVKNWNIIKNAAPFGSRFGHALISFDDKLWIIGGKIGSDSLPGDIWNSSDGITWQKVSESANLKRYYHSATVFQNQIFIIGGVNDSINNTCLNDIWVSKNGIQWSVIIADKSFEPRYGHGAVVFNNDIVLIGGRYEDFNGSKTVSDVWSSSNGRNWRNLNNNLGLPDYFLSSIVFDKRLWIIGGLSKNKKSVFSTMWYSEDGVEWTKNENHNPNSEGYHVTGTVFKNQIFMNPSGSSHIYLLK